MSEDKRYIVFIDGDPITLTAISAERAKLEYVRASVMGQRVSIYLAGWHSWMDRKIDPEELV